MPIPQRAVVKFKPGKDMREHVLKLTPDAITKAQIEDAAQQALTCGQARSCNEFRKKSPDSNGTRPLRSLTDCRN